jgi:tripartite-type tricarboxylate transporter receptor subunit TctC
MNSRNFSLLSIAIVICAFATNSAIAQSYPRKPIQAVVPFPPGGSDATFRIVSAKMSEDLGRPIVVINRPGASGVIGSEYVARAEPDGYTILLTTSSTMITRKLLSKSTPFDPLKDFTPIAQVYESVLTLTVHPSVPAKSIEELIAHAKRNPGKLTFASIGTGSAYHLDGEILKKTAGIDMIHVPYKGTGPVMTALLGGEVHVAFPSLSNIGDMHEAGRVRILAFLDPTSFPGMSHIPSINRAVPGFTKATNWIGLFGPAGMPKSVVARLNASVRTALEAPSVRKTLESRGVLIRPSSPEELAQRMRKDLVETGNLIKELRIPTE